MSKIPKSHSTSLGRDRNFARRPAAAEFFTTKAQRHSARAAPATQISRQVRQVRQEAKLAKKKTMHSILAWRPWRLGALGAKSCSENKKLEDIHEEREFNSSILQFFVPSCLRGKNLSAGAAILTLLLALLLLPVSASANPSQQDVFKSIQDNVGQSDGSATKAIPWIAGGVGVVLLLAIFGRRQTRQAAPRTMNHPGRLIKEMMNELPLKPKELKQLKVVAEEISDPESDRPTNPLVLILCPSVLAKVIKDDSTQADQKTLRVLLKKMGIR